MRNNKNGLDEMQKEKRNNIGNQMFMLMFYALLIDSGLYGAGIRWLNYPVNVMVIITVCMGIYLVRTIAANAYLPPKAQNRKTIVKLIIAIAFSIVLAISAVNLFFEPSSQSVEVINDNSALILFIVSAVGLFISLVVAAIKKISDQNDNDE